MGTRFVLPGLCCFPHGFNSYQQVPLQSVCVDALLYDLCAEVTVQQTYVNKLPYSAAECVYNFPLDEESAVFSFSAQLDGVLVEGCIREKMEARTEYAAAVAANRSAMLLQQSMDNIFHCKIGNLKSGSICSVTLKYLTVLQQEGRHNRFTLPMTIAPKYTPTFPGQTPLALQNTVHTGFHCHKCLCSPIIGMRYRCSDCAHDLCHGCYMEHDGSHSMLGADTVSLAPAHLQSKPGDLTINLDITMPSPIVSIQCPSHPDETKIEQNSYHATALFHSVSTCSLSRDFILLLEQRRCFEPRVLCELDMVNHTAAVSLAFLPPPIDMLSASQMRCELIFLIDCSGSMHGSSIDCVRECMQLTLRSLPANSCFNILIFGSQWSQLFTTSQTYDDASLLAASHYVSNLQANLGGTEIYPPLLSALTGNLHRTHPRQVFLLTDGQVSNTQQLVDLVSQHVVATRLFTLGIGDSVDRLLCKKLAQAGYGKCEFVTARDGKGSDMREKVVRQLARAMQPMLKDVKVDWGQLKGPTESSVNKGGIHTSSSFLQCPSEAPALFISNRYVLHALNVSLPEDVWKQAQAGQSVDFKCEITITACSNHPQEVDQMRHSVVLTGDQLTQARVIHTLAAKERIRELEDTLPYQMGEARKRLQDEILDLAMKHTLSSSRTSFIVVYNLDPGKEPGKEAVEEKDSLCQFESKSSSFSWREPSSMPSITAIAPSLFGSNVLPMTPRGTPSWSFSANTPSWLLSASTPSLFGSLTGASFSSPSSSKTAPFVLQSIPTSSKTAPFFLHSIPTSSSAEAAQSQPSSASEQGQSQSFGSMPSFSGCAPSIFGNVGVSFLSVPSLFHGCAPRLSGEGSMPSFNESTSSVENTSASSGSTPSIFWGASPFGNTGASFGGASPFGNTGASVGSTPSVFGGASPFGNPGGSFGTPPLIFGGVGSTAASFGSTPSIFGGVGNTGASYGRTPSNFGCASLFGNTTASSESTPSVLFGNTGASFGSTPSILGGVSSFGNTGASFGSSIPSIFGGVGNTAASSGSTPSILFGNADASFGSTPSIFGGASSFGNTVASFGSTPSIFGSVGNTAASSGSTPSIFGDASSFGNTGASFGSTPAIFGGVGNTAASSGSTPSISFGNAGASIGSTPSIFGGVSSFGNTGASFGSTPSIFGGVGNIDASFGSTPSISCGNTAASFRNTPSTFGDASFFGNTGASFGSSPALSGSKSSFQCMPSSFGSTAPSCGGYSCASSESMPPSHGYSCLSKGAASESAPSFSMSLSGNKCAPFGSTQPCGLRNMQPPSVNPLFATQSDTQKDETDTAYEALIRLQSANGMWHITPMLINIAHWLIPSSSSTLTVESVLALSKAHAINEAILGVLLALHLLEAHYKQRRAEWELLAMKALFTISSLSQELQGEIKGSILKLLAHQS